MTVTLTSPVLGQAVGSQYTGPLENWLLNEGYARAAASLAAAITVTPTAAVFTATNNAATATAAGSLVIETAQKSFTVAIANGDTAAAIATKVDTALNGYADAAIVSSKLTITSIATGPEAYVKIVSVDSAATKTATGIPDAQIGSRVSGGDGRPVGASNRGAQAALPVNDPTDAANREAPFWPDTPGDVNHAFDFDASGTDTEAPSGLSKAEIKPSTGPAAGGTVVKIYGDNLDGVTGVTFGGTAGTALSLTEYREKGYITVTTPAKAAGTYDVVVTDGVGSATVTGGFVYTA